jgi:hypothetical protein
MEQSLRIATWNTDWRRPESRDGEEILLRLQLLDPDIVCLTETHSDMLDGWPGYAIVGDAAEPRPREATRRAVLLWSRWNWTGTEPVGDNLLKQGCFVRSETHPPMGPLTIVGMVIPYFMSDVRYGTRDRLKWENHNRYLDGLQKIAPHWPDSAIALGDFNQRLPTRFPPKSLREKLQSAFSKMEIGTSGLTGPDDQRSNDHIAYGRSWVCSDRGTVSNLRTDGRELSDHFGVWLDLTTK